MTQSLSQMIRKSSFALICKFLKQNPGAGKETVYGDSNSTLLHIAVQCDRPDVYLALLKYTRASLTRKDEYGMCANDYATSAFMLFVQTNAKRFCECESNRVSLKKLYENELIMIHVYEYCSNDKSVVSALRGIKKKKNVGTVQLNTASETPIQVRRCNKLKVSIVPPRDATFWKMFEPRTLSIGLTLKNTCPTLIASQLSLECLTKVCAKQQTIRLDLLPHCVLELRCKDCDCSRASTCFLRELRCDTISHCGDTKFGSLKKLYIKSEIRISMPNLEHLESSTVFALRFTYPLLRTIVAHQIEWIGHIQTRVPLLQSLQVAQMFEHKLGHSDVISTNFFSNLRRLRVDEWCPKNTNSQTVDYPNLLDLSFAYQHRLRILDSNSLEITCTNLVSLTLRHVTSLRVKDCILKNSLKQLCSVSTLERLTLENCEFCNGDRHVAELGHSLTRLRKLAVTLKKRCDLPLCSIAFSNLQELEIASTSKTLYTGSSDLFCLRFLLTNSKLNNPIIYGKEASEQVKHINEFLV